MEVVEFRAFVFQRRFDPNRSPEETVKNEKDVYEAVMSIYLDGDKGEDVVIEVVNLLFEYCPAVLQLLHLMAEKARCDSEIFDFSIARRLVTVKN